MSRSKRKPEPNLKAVIEAEEKERIRLSRELYDSLGQKLSAAKFNVAALQDSKGSKSNKDKVTLENAMNLINESINDVRNISYTILPETLLKSGLVEALKELVSKINSEELKTELEFFGLSKRLDHITESVLFVIIQECINNVLIHAKANFLSIQLVGHKKELTILIEDNGLGFKKLKNGHYKGNGFKNMESRISYLDGEIQIDSYPGKGTTVAIEIPLSR
jgi:signal transduction histidine kinase